MAVSAERRRAHIVLPQELIDEIDSLVGPRKRSQFVQEAIEDKIGRRRRVEAFDKVVGSLVNAGPPEWATSESAAQWVHDLRYHPDKVVIDHAAPEPGA